MVTSPALRPVTSRPGASGGGLVAVFDFTLLHESAYRAGIYSVVAS